MKFLFALALSAMIMPPVWASLFLGENMYTYRAAHMHCPTPGLQGNTTPDAKTAMQLMLQNHFEQFLTLLTGGLGR